MHRVSLSSFVVAGALSLAPVALAQPAPAAPAPTGKPTPPAKKPGDKPAEAPAGADKPADAPEDKPADANPAPKAAPDEGDGGEEGAGADERTPRRAPAPLFPQPDSDAAALRTQDAARPGKKADAKPSADEVYAEDWWTHARPSFEIHGYFRVRAELFHNFSLGRVDDPTAALWPVPADNQYVGADSNVFNATSARCTGDEVGYNKDDGVRTGNLFPCKNKSQAGANLRFRLNPELHISDNLRVMSQIDLLDDVVMGSTAEGYYNTSYVAPSADPNTPSRGGWQTGLRAGYTPLGAFDSNQAPPSTGLNSLRDSIRVKRAWAEYMTPIGQLKFGRQPSHWGLGILANSGDGYDDDYQSTSDRIMFTTGIKAIDLYFAGAWDFANEGQTSESLFNPQAQAYDVAQLDDVDQYVFAVVRRTNPELQKLTLAKGGLVINGGAYVVHRKQLLANDGAGPCSTGSAALGCNPGESSAGYVRRGASAWIPDVWLQLKYKKFRFELEAVTIQGNIENTSPTGSNYLVYNGWKIDQWGLATEIEQKLVEDRLRLQFGFGWASGDPDVFGPQTGSGGLAPGNQGLQPQKGNDTISTFRFHPNYKVDLILFRNLMSRVQGAYYFRPSVEYDFQRKTDGQRFGGGLAAIWSRASEFVQTPGHKDDLGVELDGTLYFQSKDGSLNDGHERPGGFYTMLQYGVLFPLDGLGYQSREEAAPIGNKVELSSAQILRWYLGVLF